MQQHIPRILLVWLFLSLSAKAQIPTFNPYLNQSDALTNVAIFDVRVAGTYYFESSWQTGKVMLTSGDSLIGYYLRYDMIRNQLELLWGSRKLGIYGTNIDSFEWFNPEKGVRQVFTARKNFQFDKPKNVGAFLEILCEGKVMLLKSKTIIARYQSTSPSLVPDDYTSNTNTIDDYFLVLGDETFMVKNRKKTLEFLHSASIEDFVRENSLNVSVEEDLIQIANKYNMENE